MQVRQKRQYSVIYHGRDFKSIFNVRYFVSGTQMAIIVGIITGYNYTPQ